MVGEEESTGRHQSQNVLTEAEGTTTYAKRQILEAQIAFLYLVDTEMLFHVQGCTVAGASRVFVDDSSWEMIVGELQAFLALVYVGGVKGGRNIELSSFWSD
ncbi:hypothetical protein AMECASPLE_011077 [Ameca splendens]|uniref:Uncharacterized protein n=1 Tax=Ameca splendens TaxID=208324 RepID=A0ABV0YBK4_9TELE